jgi:hypothetical protein
VEARGSNNSPVVSDKQPQQMSYVCEKVTHAGLSVDTSNYYIHIKSDLAETHAVKL